MSFQKWRRRFERVREDPAALLDGPRWLHGVRGEESEPRQARRSWPREPPLQCDNCQEGRDERGDEEENIDPGEGGGATGHMGKWAFHRGTPATQSTVK